MAAVTTVLIAIDGSENSTNAFDWYIRDVHSPSNKIVLAHVSELGIQPHYGFRAGLAMATEEWKALELEVEQKNRELENKYAAKLRRLQIKYKFVKAEGQPGHHLVDMAKREKADLIVMGTRGLGTVRRTIMGSVSDFVLHHSGIPLAICKA